MKSPSAARVEFRFPTDDPSVVYHSLGAVSDIGLSRTGATIAELEAVDLALEALVETVAEAACITSAGVAVVDTGLIVDLSFDGSISASAEDLAVYGLVIEAMGNQCLSASIESKAP